MAQALKWCDQQTAGPCLAVHSDPWLYERLLAGTPAIWRSSDAEIDWHALSNGMATVLPDGTVFDPEAGR